MFAPSHHLQDGDELLEVGTLRGSQWALFEERHHRPYELRSPLHTEAAQRYSMVVGTALLEDRAAPEHLLKEFESDA